CAWVTIHEESVFARVLLGGETAAAETWTEGLWDTPDLAALLHLYAKNRASLRLGRVIPWLGRLPALVRRELRRNSRAGSIRNVQAHYDLGNDFYRLFLDGEAMAYSCALWAPGDSLEDAQRRKMDRICDLLELGPGDRLLEIGCGWGGLALHAART